MTPPRAHRPASAARWPRGRRAWAGACLALLGLLVGVESSASARLGQDLPDRTKPIPFKHSNHVADVWIRGVMPETLRDCRGCHVYDATGEVRDPQAVCNNCHIRSEQNQSTFEVLFDDGWETLEPLRGGNPFDHYGHRGLACRECHRPTGKWDVDPMPVRPGFSDCLRCHSPGGPDFEYEVVLGQDRAELDPREGGFTGLLNNDENMLPDRLGPFLHSEHLIDLGAPAPLAELRNVGPDATTCTTCHSPVLTATVDDLHAHRFRAMNCGQCHISSAGPLEFETRIETGQSQAAGTFSHAAHLGIGAARDAALASAASYDLIEDHGCLACHGHDETARTFRFGPVRLSGSGALANTHEGCVECHSGAEWSPGRHGDWDQQGCTGCHAFDGRSLKEDRPTVDVRRRRSEPFVIEKQVHPHIAGAPTPLSESSCGDCHRGPVADLPSRLMTRPFSHATHLPANPGPQHCATCHGTRVDRADGSAMIGDFLAGRALDPSDPNETHAGLTYDPSGCTDCHRGGLPVPSPVALDDVQPARVVAFSHRQHLAAGIAAPDGRPIDCLTCHDAGAGRRDHIGTKPEALSCVQCHDHRPGPTGAISGNLSPEQAASCSRCHAGDVPNGGAVEVRRSRLASLKGELGQYHEEGRSCTECHRVAEPSLLADGSVPYPTGDHTYGIGGWNTRLAAPDQHRDYFLRDEKNVQCTDCHWTHRRGYQIESEPFREQFGSDLSGWPGKDWAATYAID